MSIRRGIVAVIAFSATLAGIVSVQSANAVPVPPTITTFYKVINVSTYADWIDFSRPVASCSAGAGGTCAITHTTSVATTVQSSLGYSVKDVAATIGFSLTRTSSTSATCTSPKMRTGQTWMAFARGTEKMYRIQKWHSVSTAGPAKPTLVATSGLLQAFQPYSYPAIFCQIR